MKLRIYNLPLILMIYFSAGYSQGSWELLIPSGTSNQMVSLYFLDELNGWSVGQYGTITKTTDGGLNWEIVRIEYLTDLTDVYFPTTTVGYIVGEDGLILKTDNGGMSWNKQDNAFSNNLNRVRFRDTENGWAVGEAGLILHTSNGGDTWTQQTSGAQYSLYGIEIPDGQQVWIVGEDNALLVTDDDGATWQKIDPQYSNPLGDNIDYNYRDIYFANDSAGWACGNYYEKTHANRGPFIAQTLDAGKNWYLQKNKLANYEDLAISGYQGLPAGQQIYFKDNLTTGLCLTAADAEDYNNIPFYIRTGGSEWNVFIDGAYEETRRKGRFQFLSESRVINTGFQGDIRFSDHSGRNWYFNNNNNRFWYGFLIGPDNSLHISRRKPIRGTYDNEFKHLISIDRGKSWDEVNSTIHYLDGSDEDVNSKGLALFGLLNIGQFTLSSNSRLFTIHHRNRTDTTTSILYSDDMGINYYELHSGSPIHHHSQDWLFLTPDTLIYTYISNEGQTFYCSTSYDGGATIISKIFNGVWNNLSSSWRNPAKINDSYYLDKHTGFIVGTDGNILKTEDTGQSWTNIYSGVVENLRDVEFINRETGFAVGNFGRILKSVDGGETWYKTNSGTQENIYSIAFLNDAKGWVGTESGMRYTTDAGETWHGVPLRYQHGAIHHIRFDHEGTGYAYTFWSAVPMEWDTENEYSGSYVMLQRMLSGTAGLHNPEMAHQPDVEQVSLSPNYPNPFNSSTRIEYNLPQEGGVMIRIYNISGQLVRTLVNRVEKSGRHSVIWNGSSDSDIAVSSGIYIYQLQYNGQQRNRKLVLIK